MTFANLGHRSWSSPVNGGRHAVFFALIDGQLPPTEMRRQLFHVGDVLQG
jgi:hypothetical protein